MTSVSRGGRIVPLGDAIWDDPRYVREYFRGARSLICALRHQNTWRGLSPAEVARTHRLIEIALGCGAQAAPPADGVKGDRAPPAAGGEDAA